MKEEKQRYILFKIIRKDSKKGQKIHKKDFLNALWNNIWRYFGMNTAIKIGLWLHELNFKENYGIIRCSHITKEVMISSLSLIRKINQEKVIISPIKTSGTFLSIKRFINGNHL
jgi:RNase P/RNase MRP subunit POP5